jgi:hypothetical protein
MLENKLQYRTGQPQIEIQFYSYKTALKAVKLLAKPEIETSKIASIMKLPLKNLSFSTLLKS